MASLQHSPIRVRPSPIRTILPFLCHFSVDVPRNRVLALGLLEQLFAAFNLRVVWIFHFHPTEERRSSATYLPSFHFATMPSQSSSHAYPSTSSNFHTSWPSE